MILHWRKERFLLCGWYNVQCRIDSQDFVHLAIWGFRTRLRVYGIEKSQRSAYLCGSRNIIKFYRII